MKSKALQLGIVAVVVAVAAYFVLNWLAPIKHEEAAADTGPKAEGVFAGALGEGGGETAAAAAPETPAAPAAEAGAASETPAAGETPPPAEMASTDAAPVDDVASQESAPVAPPPCETVVSAGKNPIIVAAVEVSSSGTAAAAPAGGETAPPAEAPQMGEAAPPPPEPAPAPEPTPAPAPEPAPVAEAAPAPAPTPAPEPAPEPAMAQAGPPADAAPAPKPAKPKAKPKPPPDTLTPWWPKTRSPSNVNLVYAGDAEFSRSIVLLFDSSFENTDSANANIKVMDSKGKTIKGKWLANLKNKKMLLFKVPSGGRYVVVVDGALAGASGKTVGSTVQGPVFIQ